jgi:hypothetical protein
MERDASTPEAVPNTATKARRRRGPRPLFDRRSDRLRLWGLLLFVVWWWWPAQLQFRSDDYLAIHYVQDWARVLQDFWQPQYDALRVALFHRPIITLSIAVDAWIGGNEPFWPLLANVLVHCANALLAYRLLRRFLPATPAWAAVAFWALHPGHTEALHWMVGRVDTHATFFYLLTLLLYCRHAEGRQNLTLVLVSFVLGCLTKELCLTIPAAIFALELGYGVHFDNRPLIDRGLAALRRLWVWAAALGAVLGMRYLVLGEAIGGYQAAQIDPVAPFRIWGMFFAFPTPGVQIALVAPLLGLLLLAFVLRGKSVRALYGIALFVITALPSAGSVAQDMQASARYYYLPNLAIAGATALGGPLPPLLLLASHLGADKRMHSDSLEMAEQVAEIRAAARSKIAGAPETEPVLVPAPRASESGRVLFAVGVDRLGSAPFSPEERIVLPRRALGDGRIRPAPPRGDAQAFYVGPETLDHETLGRLNQDPLFATIGLRGVDAPALRVTVAQSLGMTESILPTKSIRNAAGQLEIHSSVQRLFYIPPLGFERPLAHLLWPGTEISLDARPWMYLEALDASGKSIAAGHAPLPLPLTREYGLPTKRTGLWLIFGLLALAVFLRLFRR